MLKKWSQFVFESNDTIKLTYKETLDKLGFKEVGDMNDPNKYDQFGLSTDDIEDNFYRLTDSGFELSVVEYKYLSVEHGNVTPSIFIGDVMKPTLEITIESDGDGDNNIIKEIKRVLKKIVAMNKFKSGYDFNNIYIIDPDTEDFDEENIDPIKSKLDFDDPFSIISINNNGTFAYNYSDVERLSSYKIRIFLVSDTKFEVTDRLFMSFYEIPTDKETKVDKRGGFWQEFMFKDIAEYLFKDNYVERFFEPDDIEYDIYSLDHSYIIDNVIDSITTENKNKLLKYLFEKEGIEEINEHTDEQYEDLNDLIENIDDSDFKSLLRGSDNDIVNDITWRYDDMMSDKYYKEASEYIKNETTKYIDEYIECGYEEFYDDENHVDVILIKFDPKIFIPDYGTEYDWSENIEGYSIKSHIEEVFADEHASQISWNDYVGDQIYLDGNDINGYIVDIFGDHGIK